MEPAHTRILPQSAHGTHMQPVLLVGPLIFPFLRQAKGRQAGTPRMHPFDVQSDHGGSGTQR
jgi:hypothetical protein